jgi:hypothetical protein
MTNSGNGQGSGLPSSLAAALALLVAALAAIGLTGAALLRAVRNHPDQVGSALKWALIGGAIIALAQILIVVPTGTGQAAPQETKVTVASGQTAGQHWRRLRAAGRWARRQWHWFWARRRGVLRLSRQVITAVGIILLVYSVVLAVNVGTDAVSAREGPLVSIKTGPISAVPGSSTLRNIEITVSVRAVGMSTDNDVAVQVVGLHHMQAWVDLDNVKACESNHTYNDKKQFSKLNGSDAELVAWNRLGPDSNGSINASWKLQVPLGRYVGLCALAVFGGNLHAHFKDKGNNPDTSAAYIRLSSQTKAAGEHLQTGISLGNTTMRSSTIRRIGKQRMA